MVAMTLSLDVSTTMRLFDAELATYRRLPFGESATAIGSAPTRIVPLTLPDGMLNTETVPSPALATYAVLLSGCAAILVGSRPTPISACLCTLCGVGRSTVTVLTSGLTLRMY